MNQGVINGEKLNGSGQIAQTQIQPGFQSDQRMQQQTFAPGQQAFQQQVPYHVQGIQTIHDP